MSLWKARTAPPRFPSPSGINISEYTLRRAIRMKELPCKVIGRTYLIHWDSFLRWISCEQ